MRRSPLLFLLASLLAVTAAAEPHIEWPPDGLLDADNRLTVGGLLPGALLIVEATERSANDVEWRAFSTYMADDRGIIDTAVAPALAGTWTGVDPAGWLWSMLPQPADSLVEMRTLIGRDPALLQRWQRPGGGERRITLSVREGAEVIGSRQIVRRRLAGDVVIEDIEQSEHGVAGRLLLPPGEDGEPSLGVVVLGGSFGGLRLPEAELLASSGYPVFALAYFKYPGLPDSGSLLPLEYFADAVDWFRDRAKVRRVVMLGRSRGGEATLLFGALFPGSVDGLIAVVPSHLVNNGEGLAWGDWLHDESSMWTRGGSPVQFVSYVESQTPTIVAKRKRLKRGLPGYAIAPEYALVWRGEADGPNAIDVADIPVPFLVQAGAVDGVWPSAYSARLIRRAAAAAALATVEIFPEAGHSWGLPGEISTMADFAYVGQNFNGFIALGGSAPGNADAARQSWHSMLRFLATVADRPVAEQRQ